MAQGNLELKIIFDSTGAIKGIEQVNKSVKGQEKTIIDTNKNISGSVKSIKASYLAVAAGIAGAVVTIKKFVDAALKQERAEKTLAAAMKQAGTFTKEAFQENLKYASSLQKLTTYGDEQIIGVQKLLTNFGIEGQALKDLTKATLDLAAAKGMDLTSAADLVAKSVGSSTNALSRYGIQVEGAVGSTERINQAVQNITKLFGGAAQAEAENYAGTFTQIKNIMSDVAEVIGFGILNSTNLLTKAFKSSLTSLLDFITKRNESISVTKDISDAENEYKNALNETQKNLDDVNKSEQEKINLRLQQAKGGIYNAILKANIEYKNLEKEINDILKKQVGNQKSVEEVLKTVNEKRIKANEELSKQDKWLKTSLTRQEELRSEIIKFTEKYSELIKQRESEGKSIVKLDTLNKQLNNEIKSGREIDTKRLQLKDEIARLDKTEEGQLQRTNNLRTKQNEIAISITKQLQEDRINKEDLRILDSGLIELINKNNKNKVEGNKLTLKEIENIKIKNALLEQAKQLGLSQAELSKLSIDEIKKRIEARQKEIELEKKAKDELIIEALKLGISEKELTGLTIEQIRKRIEARQQELDKTKRINDQIVSGIKEIAQAISPVAGAIVDTVTNIVSAFQKSIEEGLIQVAVEGIKFVIDQIKAGEEIKNQLEKESIRNKQDYELRKLDLAIDRINKERDAEIAKYNALTQAETDYNNFLAKKEEERIASLTGAELEEALLRKAALEAREEQEKKQLEIKKKYDKEIAKIEAQKFEIQKKIDLARLDLDEVQALSAVPFTFFDNEDDKAKAEIAQNYARLRELIKGLKAPSIPAAQFGMRNSKGGLTLVGERGAELVNLPKGADVFTAGETQRIIKSISNNYSSDTTNANKYMNFSGANFNIKSNNASGFIAELSDMAQNTNGRIFPR